MAMTMTLSRTMPSPNSDNNKWLKKNNYCLTVRILITIELLICIVSICITSKVFVSTMAVKTTHAENVVAIILFLHVNTICFVLFLVFRYYCCCCHFYFCRSSYNNNDGPKPASTLPTTITIKTTSTKYCQLFQRIAVTKIVIVILGVTIFFSNLQCMNVIASSSSFDLNRNVATISHSFPSTCTFLKKSCFNINRCASSITSKNVYIYNISKFCNKKQIGKIVMPHQQNWYWHVDLMLEKKALENSKMINNLKVVTDPEKACLFIVPPHTYKCFPDYSKLPYWGNNGENHVLIEMTRDQYWNKYGGTGDHEIWKNLDRIFHHSNYGDFIGSVFTRRHFYSRKYNIE